MMILSERRPEGKAEGLASSKLVLLELLQSGSIMATGYNYNPAV